VKSSFKGCQSLELHLAGLLKKRIGIFVAAAGEISGKDAEAFTGVLDELAQRRACRQSLAVIAEPVEYVG
jgi:hypothetical protein